MTRIVTICSLRSAVCIGAFRYLLNASVEATFELEITADKRYRELFQLANEWSVVDMIEGNVNISSLIVIKH